MTFNISQMERVFIAVVLALFGASLVFFVSAIGFSAYAEWRYAHPGSLTGLWAFYNSLPIAAASAPVIFALAFFKIKPKSQAKS